VTVAGEVRRPRALNRALLERQLLARRVRRPALDAVGHLIGLHAQEPQDPYVGLWSRLADFDPAELGRAVEAREVVRIALLRSTIHLVTARDCLALRPVLQAAGERLARGQFGRRLAGVDLAELDAYGRALVEERPLAFGELGTLLGRRWPGRDPMALAQTVRARLALVQVPPRGVWGRGGRALHTTVESWLGRPLDADPAPDRLLLRYLAAFGPATVPDAQTWSGLTRLAEVAERLRPRLRTFRDEQGRELLDLPDAPRPDPDTPAPVRFLPQYDNALLGYADRGRIASPAAHALWADRTHFYSSFLVDGVVRGVWRVVKERGRATLMARTLRPLSTEDDAAVTAEATALLALLVPAVADREVRIEVVS
jgi:hypothetical protein